MAVALAVALAATGCGAASGDKAGGGGGITVLRLATPDPPGRPSSEHAEHFAQRVRELSDGRLRVEIVWEAAGAADTGVRSWDQKVAQRVVDGREELGLVPARAWDELGVTSLHPLQAPFLVTSDAALDAVVTDDVAEQLLAGLAPVGVTGLALLPEGLRHPFGLGRPLLEPDDYTGALIRAPRSTLLWDVLRALGARPDDLNGPDVVPALESGELRGAETSVVLLPTLPQDGLLTGNVTLYAKANALVAGAAALERLSAGERSALQRAAVETRDHAVDGRQSEVDALRSACEAGATVVVATDQQLQELEAAVGGVLDRLRADPEVGALLDRVADVVEQAGPPPRVEPCGSVPDGAEPAGESTDALDGLWRFEVPYEDGVRAGLSAARAAEDLGVHTVQLDGGRYTGQWRSRRGEQTCDGTYRMADGVVVVTAEPPCSGSWEARPQLAADEIRWSDVRTHDRAGDREDQLVRELLHGTPWRRIDRAGRP